MTDEQIKEIALSIATTLDAPIDFVGEYELFLKELLRRYALVEKSKIKEAWSMITGVYLDHDHISYDGARYLFNEVLFPELTKETDV